MRSTVSADDIMNSNFFSASSNYPLELDESTIDFVTSCSPFTAFKSPPSVSPSSYSSNEGSPTSNWTAELDDSGLDATNMSCCTSYASSCYSSNSNNTNLNNSNNNNNNTESSCGGNSMVNTTSFAGTTNFMLQNQDQRHQQPATSQLLPQSVQPGMQSVSQQTAVQRPAFQRSSSVYSDSSSVSNMMSESSGGFRSQSNSFSNGQRPIFNQMASRLASSANSMLQSQSAPSMHQDETEATLFEFPPPNPIQVAQVSLTTGSADQSAQQPELRILSQPSRNHRARYRTEGSRGAIKDRHGQSFPVIKLHGYNLTPVKVRCFIGHDKKPGEAHLYYQASRIIGKNITPCVVSKTDGIKIIEFELSPENDMQAVVNCIGIAKERYADLFCSLVVQLLLFICADCALLLSQELRCAAQVV